MNVPENSFPSRATITIERPGAPRQARGEVPNADDPWRSLYSLSKETLAGALWAGAILGLGGTVGTTGFLAAFTAIAGVLGLAVAIPLAVVAIASFSGSQRRNEFEMAEDTIGWISSPTAFVAVTGAALAGRSQVQLEKLGKTVSLLESAFLLPHALTTEESPIEQTGEVLKFILEACEDFKCLEHPNDPDDLRGDRLDRTDPGSRPGIDDTSPSIELRTLDDDPHNDDDYDDFGPGEDGSDPGNGTPILGPY